MSVALSSNTLFSTGPRLKKHVLFSCRQSHIKGMLNRTCLFSQVPPVVWPSLSLPRNQWGSSLCWFAPLNMLLLQMWRSITQVIKLHWRTFIQAQHTRSMLEPTPLSTALTVNPFFSWHKHIYGMILIISKDLSWSRQRENNPHTNSDAPSWLLMGVCEQFSVYKLKQNPRLCFQPLATDE